MKKTTILLITILLLLCSCSKAINNGSNTDTTESIYDVTNEETEPSEDTFHEETKAKDDPKPRPSSSYKIKHFAFRDDNTLLKIKHPSYWSFKKADYGYNIICDGEFSGYLIGEPADDLSDWTILSTETHSTKGILIKKHVEQKSNRKEYRFRYVYEYNENSNTRFVTLTVNFSDLDETNEKRLYTDIVTVNKLINNTMGVLSGDNTEPSSILILGNSFINTSDIGDVLSELLKNNEKNCNVEAISTGYARVGTYTSDPYMLANIRVGNYDMIFICGLYAKSEVDNLGILKEACDYSATELVIFPAHNESEDAITFAKDQYPSIFCLNWKAELDALIDLGTNRWDLYYDDDHKHSTPLAGYVGAHMIYRAIYNELPTEPMKHILTQSYIDNILGDYAYNGDICSIEEDKIAYLN